MDALGDKLAIGQEGLQEILDGLANRGYRVIGPTMRDGAIIYENIARLEDLPRMTSDLTAATLAVLTERT